MNQNRTPAGVPTGGQFAEQAKGEAEVTLSSATPEASTPWIPSRDDDAKLLESAAAIEGYEDRLRCASMLEAFKEANGWNGPEVDTSRIAYIEVHEHHVGDGPYMVGEAYDSNGDALGDGSEAALGSTFGLGGVPAEFQAQVMPENLDRIRPECLIDVRKVTNHDFHTDLRDTQAKVMFDQLHALQHSGHAEGYIITRQAVGEDVDEEAQSRGVHLTDDDIEQIVDQVGLPDDSVWEPVQDQRFGDVGRAVEQFVEARQHAKFEQQILEEGR